MPAPDRYDEWFRDDLEILGRELTLSTRQPETSDGEVVRDDYNDIVWAEKTETTVTGEVAMRGSATFDKYASGVDVSADITGWVPDDTTITEGGKSQTTRATRVTYNGRVYVVRLTVPEDNGLTRFYAEMEEVND